MKKLLVVVMAVVFVFALSAVAMEGHGQETMPKQCAEHMKMMKKDCPMMTKDGKMGGFICGLNADVKVKNTKDGAVIELKAKKDGDSVKAIQDTAKAYEEMISANTAAAGDEIVTCPVMGTKFPKSKAFSSTVYKGKTYYFCCGECPEKFKADPEKYIGK